MAEKDKNDFIQIRVSKEEKEEIRKKAEKMTDKMGVKMTISSYLLWLYRKYGK